MTADSDIDPILSSSDALQGAFLERHLSYESMTTTHTLPHHHDEDFNQSNNNMSSVTTSTPQSRCLFIFGCSLLLLIIFIWVFSSALIQSILVKQYDEPFMMTFFSSCVFAIYLPCFGLYTYCKKRYIRYKLQKLIQSSNVCQSFDDSQTIASSSLHHPEIFNASINGNSHVVMINQDFDDSDNNHNRSNNVTSSPSQQQQQQQHHKTGMKENTNTTAVEISNLHQTYELLSNSTKRYVIWYNFKHALIVLPLWICANLFFNFSLRLISVTTSVILATTTTFFTMLFSSIVFRIPPHTKHIFCIILAIIGSGLVTYFSNVEPGGSSTSSSISTILSSSSSIPLSTASFSTNMVSSSSPNAPWSGHFETIWHHIVTFMHHCIGPGTGILSALLYGIYCTYFDYISDQEKPKHQRHHFLYKIKKYGVEHMFQQNNNIDVNNTNSSTSQPQQNSYYKQHSATINKIVEEIVEESHQTKLLSSPLSSSEHDINEQIIPTDTTSHNNEISTSPPPPFLAPALLFGLCGLLSITIILPCIILIIYTHPSFLSISFPHLHQIPLILCATLSGAALTDFLFANALLLTNPLLATLAVPASIPLSMIYGAIFNHMSITCWIVVGSLCILIATSVITADQYDLQLHEAKLADISQDMYLKTIQTQQISQQQDLSI